jgi:hypothetical protein
LKKTTLRKTHDSFGKMSHETRSALLSKNEYWYEVSAVCVKSTFRVALFNIASV